MLQGKTGKPDEDAALFSRKLISTLSLQGASPSQVDRVLHGVYVVGEGSGGHAMWHLGAPSIPNAGSVACRTLS